MQPTLTPISPYEDAVITAATVAEDSLVAAEPVAGTPFVIGGRVFVVCELAFAPFLALVVLLVRVMRDLAKLDLLRLDMLSSLTTLDSNPAALPDLLDLLSNIAEHLPETFEKVFGLMLGVESPQDGAFVYTHIKLTQAADVVLAWMQYNPWRDVMHKLFTVWQQIRDEARQIQRSSLTTPAVSSPTSPAPAMDPTPRMP